MDQKPHGLSGGNSHNGGLNARPLPRRPVTELREDRLPNGRIPKSESESGTRPKQGVSALERLQTLPATLSQVRRLPFLSKNVILDEEALAELNKSLPHQKMLFYIDICDARVANDAYGREPVDNLIQGLEGVTSSVINEMSPFFARMFQLGGDEFLSISGNNHGSGLCFAERFFERYELLRFRQLDALTGSPGASNRGELIAARRTTTKFLEQRYFADASTRTISRDDYKLWLLNFAKREEIYDQESLQKLRRQDPKTVLAAITLELAKGRSKKLCLPSVGCTIIDGPLTFDAVVNAIGRCSTVSLDRKAKGLPGLEGHGTGHSAFDPPTSTSNLPAHVRAWERERRNYLVRKSAYSRDRALALASGDDKIASAALRHLTQDPGLESQILRYEIVADNGITLRQLGVRVQPDKGGVFQLRTSIESFGIVNTHGGYTEGDGLFETIAHEVGDFFERRGGEKPLSLRCGGGELISLVPYSGPNMQLTREEIQLLTHSIDPHIDLALNSIGMTRGHREVATMSKNALEVLNGGTPLHGQKQDPIAGSVSFRQGEELILPLE